MIADDTNDRKQNRGLRICGDKLPLDPDINKSMPRQSESGNPKRSRKKNQSEPPDFSLQRVGRKEVPAGWNLYRASTVLEKNEDPERLGRWSSLKIQIKAREKSFIMAYMPCRPQINLEVITAYAQQRRELTNKGNATVDPRSRMIDDPRKSV